MMKVSLKFKPSSSGAKDLLGKAKEKFPWMRGKAASADGGDDEDEAPPAPDDEGSDDEGDEDEAGGDQAATEAMMDFNAAGEHNDTEKQLAAFKKLLSLCQ
jgi:hypothetical protein